MVVACLLLPASAVAGIIVEIDGVRGLLEENVRSYLDLVRFGDRQDLSDAAVRRLFQRSRAQAAEALRPYGYYKPVIQTSLTRENGDWRARLQIDPGRPVHWSEVDVRVDGPGSKDRRFARVIRGSPLAPGRQVRHPEYDGLRAALERTAKARGYLDATFTERRLVVDPDTGSARAVLHLQTGPRYRFGQVTVEQTALKDTLVERLVFAHEGDPYDAAALLKTQYALTDVGYFSSVLVDRGEPDPKTHTVPVTVTTTKIARQRIRLGLGYATDSRLRILLGSDWRRINSRGHSASAELHASQVKTELALRYQIPVGDLLTERFAFRGGFIEETLADLDSRRTTLGANYLRTKGLWERSLFGDFVEETTREPGQGKFTEFLFVPGIGMERIDADDPINPTRGWRLRGDLRGSTNMLGAQADFLRFEATASLVRPLSQKWRLSLRGELGTSAVDGFEGLPASQRFYAGGDQSVRGYAYQALSPRNEAGTRVGGRHLLFGSVEVQRRLSRLFSAAAFVDTGNAFDKWGDPLESSVGLGVHVHTPVGPVRIEVAKSITQGLSPRLHISVRPDL